MSDLAKLEAELAAAKADRARAQAAREEAGKAKRLEAQIAREKQAAVDDATFADLREKHGDRLRRINTAHGMVVVGAPPALGHRKFMDALVRSDHPNPKVRASFTDASADFALLCVVHPSRERFEELCEKSPPLIAAAANAAQELGQPQVVEDEGK